MAACRHRNLSFGLVALLAGLSSSLPSEAPLRRLFSRVDDTWKETEGAALATLAALDADDECFTEGPKTATECALNALQLRGQRLNSEAISAEAAGAEDWSQRLKVMGRAGVRAPASKAAQEQTSTKPFPAPQRIPQRRAPCDIEAKSPANYTLSWKAQGKHFFDDFTFMTVDETHGANDYADKASALREGLAVADANRAILRTGRSSVPYKRRSVNIHTNYAWDPEHSFVAVIRYNHVPHGCGIWPGIWAMNSDKVWPAGGELDILEYANSEANKVTFHIDKGCRLDPKRMSACMSGDMGAGSADCATDYFSNLFGCRPSQRQQTGDWYASQPGVLAAEWTPTHVKVFHIPESKIPADLVADAPNPSSWDDFVIAYLPFVGHCPVGPQEFVINIQMCGDWAGGAWEKSSCPANTGVTATSKTCNNDIWDPAQDCCTHYVTSSAGEAAFNRTAHFDIAFMKVYTGADPSVSRRLSGTFNRGGVPLTAPAPASKRR